MIGAGVSGLTTAVRLVRELFAEHTDELEEMTYLLPQGDVPLLGGSADKGQWDPVPDPAVADAIVARCAGTWCTTMATVAPG